jgi:hypothetical protein
MPGISGRELELLSVVKAAERLSRETSIEHTVNDVDAVLECDRQEARKQLAQNANRTRH